MVEVKTFAAADYAVFALTLLFSASIGVFYACAGSKQSTTKEFLMANRSMPVAPVALSMLASFMSAITLLGTPAEMYIFGTQYWMIILSYFIVMPAAAYIYIPVFYELGITSAFEYLELRFNTVVRCAGSLTFMTQMLLYMAIVLYAPSLALEAVTGFNVWAGVLSVGIVCTFYTTLGGMKAVMWTDTFQVIMMFAGMLAVLIQGSAEVGGFAKAWEIAEKNARVEFFNFDPDPKVRHTVWNLVIGGTFTWLAVYGVNQAQVQRALTCPTLKKAQLSLLLNIPGLTLLLCITCMVGIVIFAKYHTCDPLTNNVISSKDQLLPLFVMDILSHLPGLPGLFVAGLFSGALSTISSGLNSLSAVTLEDFIRKLCCTDMTEERATLVSKILACSYGVVCIALTFVAAQLGGVLEAALALFGMIGGPLLGLFTLGMFFPWANSFGAMFGLITSIMLQFWIGVGAKVSPTYLPRPPVYIYGCEGYNGTTPAYRRPIPTLPPLPDVSGVQALYSLSYMWYSATGVLVVIVVGLIVSFITGATDPEELDSRTIVPIFDIVTPYLPEKWRIRLRFGVKHSKRRRGDPSPPRSANEVYTNPAGPDATHGSIATISQLSMGPSQSSMGQSKSSMGRSKSSMGRASTAHSQMSLVSYESSV